MQMKMKIEQLKRMDHLHSPNAAVPDCADYAQRTRNTEWTSKIAAGNDSKMAAELAAEATRHSLAVYPWQALSSRHSKTSGECKNDNTP